MPRTSKPRLSPDHAELLTLSVLAEGPSYGYAIAKRIAATSEGSIEVGPAKLYPLLASLESQKLVTTSWEEVKAPGAEKGASGRRRKWYALTPKGQRRLAQRVTAHRAFQRVIDAFIAGSGVEEAGR